MKTRVSSLCMCVGAALLLMAFPVSFVRAAAPAGEIEGPSAKEESLTKNAMVSDEKREAAKKACEDAKAKAQESGSTEDKTAANKACLQAVCFDDSNRCKRIPQNCMKYMGLFDRTDKACGLPEGFTATTANIESSCTANTADGKEKGIFRLNDGDCRDVGLAGTNLYDPEQAARCLCGEMKMMRDMYRKRFGSDPTQGWQYYLMHQQRARALDMMANPACNLGVCAINAVNNGGRGLSTGAQFIQAWINTYNKKSIYGTGDDSYDPSGYGSYAVASAGNGFYGYGNVGGSYGGYGGSGYGSGYGGYGGYGGGNYGGGGYNTSGSGSSQNTTPTNTSIKVIVQNTDGTTQTYTIAAGSIATGASGSHTWLCGSVQKVMPPTKASEMMKESCSLLKVN